jgi:UDP:flavonoid glycosyltransferase YjiC (YdhE family)
MRMVFATTAGEGHFGPLVPMARACVAAGHEVVVAAPESFADAVARAGLTHAGFADVPPEIMGPVFGRLPELPPEEANRVVIEEIFGRLDARAALPGVTALLRDWAPDVVVREPCELGSLVAAEAAGIPHAQVAIGIAVAEEHAALHFTEPIAALAELAGVEPEQAQAALLSMPRFSCVPAVVDEAATTVALDGIPAHGPLRRFRFELPPPSAGLPAPWGDPDRPLVYVTFGSVAASIGPFGALYPAALAALADLPVRVLMTTGTKLETGELGPVPPNARVEAWWPQHDVLPHAAAVVGHGGFGTTIAALAAGVPQVVVPLFAHDQFVNAAHVAAVGAGVWLDGGPAGVQRLSSTLSDFLDSSVFAEGAAEVARQMAALPPVADCVAALEELARG